MVLVGVRKIINLSVEQIESFRICDSG